MKILLVNDFPLDSFGGGEIHVRQLKRLLEEKGHEVVFYCPERKYSLFWKILNFPERKRIHSIVRKGSFDVVHVHSVSRNLSPLFLVGLPCRRVVMTIHSYCYCALGWGVDSSNRPLYGFGLGSILRCKNQYSGLRRIAYNVSRAVVFGLHRHIITRCVHVLVCPSKDLTRNMRAISRKLAAHVPHLNDDPSPALLANTKDPCLFLFVGRLSAEKGVDVALKALEYLVYAKGFQHIKLRIVGDGPAVDSLRLMTRQLHLEEHVEFTGKVEHSLLKMHYQSAVALLVPSLWLEAFGLINMEAMRNGTPVIGSQIGGIPDIVKHGRTGFLFSPGDHENLAKCMERLYGRVAISKKLGRQGRDFARMNFSKELCYRRLLSVYGVLRD